MIKRLVRWAVITSCSSDDKDFPIHQTTYVGKVGDGLAWYPYGFHANPGPGALALMFSVNSDPENRVVFPGSPKERGGVLLPTPLSQGEVLVYNPTTQSFIHMKNNGEIDIKTAISDINIETIAGDINIETTSGDINARTTTGNMDLNAVNATLTALGIAQVNATGLVDINALAAVDIDAVGDITIASSVGTVEITGLTGIRTKSTSTRFQNAAGTDDLGLVLRTWFNYIATSSFHTVAFRNQAATARNAIDALR
jgi:hypothetical protein